MRQAHLLCALSATAFALASCSVHVNTSDEPPPPRPPQAPPPTPPPPPAQPAPEPRFLGVKLPVNDKGEVGLPDPVLFESGTARLKPESDAVLDLVQRYLEDKREVTKLRIEGHTDTDSTNQANMRLSTDRALAVSGWLVAKGIDCNRLVPVGFGEERLVVNPEVSDGGKAQNRRVVFVRAEVDGKPVGDRPVDGGPPGQKAGDPCD